MFHNRKTTLLIVAVFLISLGFVISSTMAFAEKPNRCPCKYTSDKIVRNSYKFDTWYFDSSGDYSIPEELTYTMLSTCDSEDGVIYMLDMYRDGEQIYYQCQVQNIDGAVLVNFLESIPAEELSAGELLPDWYETCRDELKDASNDLYDLWGLPGNACE